MFLSRFFAAVLLVAPLGATAHEFWIEPEQFQAQSGATLKGKFKNGQEFKGTTLSFFDRSSARFEMSAGGEVIQITPRAGDSPALNVTAPVKNGLVSVVHETTPSFVTYREWAKFEKFVAHKDFKTALADHQSAGWSEVRFRERYTRHAKALIAVGTGEGADVASGMETEFVALTNPYKVNFTNQMKVSLLYQGAPRPDAQVEVFERAPDKTVTITLHRTDAAGMASIPVKPGHSYLFDAVVLRPAPDATAEENAVVWETFWAALTFAVPQ
ncbi:MAG: DUF4198 domain-containing protein [Sulfitobacter sp.]